MARDEGRAHYKTFSHIDLERLVPWLLAAVRSSPMSSRVKLIVVGLIGMTNS